MTELGMGYESCDKWIWAMNFFLLATLKTEYPIQFCQKDFFFLNSHWKKRGLLYIGAYTEFGFAHFFRKIRTMVAVNYKLILVDLHPIRPDGPSLISSL
jgi:hypothetical protein